MFENLTCMFPENFEFGKQVVAATMPQFVSARFSAINNQVNCLIFAIQPPNEFPQGVGAYPIAMNLYHDVFKKECYATYGFFKDKSDKLIEKIEMKGK